MEEISRYIPWLIITILTAYPAWVLLKKSGKSKFWILASLIPIGSIILLWALAFGKWETKEEGN